MSYSLKIANYSAIYGDRVSRGCSLCFQGSKAVIFVTGLCRERCYYCPVGLNRIRKDVFYVNEKEVKSIDDMISEIERSGADSASLTGGDPLERLERTISIIEALKSSFGSSFHLHLYTNGILIRRDILKRLDRAGLDEIRFHPTEIATLKRINEAKRETSMSVGAEIPAIPGREKEIVDLAVFLDSIGADFLNINELDVSESNVDSLQLAGFIVSKDGKSIVGSAETALNAMREAMKLGLKIPIHFCPASFKDRIQTRNRFLRTIRSDLKIYEKSTSEGTVIFGVLLDYDAHRTASYVEKGILFECRWGLCFHPDDLETIRKINVGRAAEIIESHPTDDRFVLNRERIMF
ncbi:MAG: radical SAM protein [Fervidicoccaceae archaeon]